MTNSICICLISLMVLFQPAMQHIQVALCRSYEKLYKEDPMTQQIKDIESFYLGILRLLSIYKALVVIVLLVAFTSAIREGNLNYFLYFILIICLFVKDYKALKPIGSEFDKHKEQLEKGSFVAYEDGYFLIDSKEGKVKVKGSFPELYSKGDKVLFMKQAGVIDKSLLYENTKEGGKKNDK